jgi:hypothetical protein
VIRAAKPLACIALIVIADNGASMTAAIMQHIDLIVCMPDTDNQLAPHGSGKEIACFGDLTVVANIDPRSLEDASHFQFENSRIDEYAPMDPVFHYQVGNLVPFANVLHVYHP